MERLGIKIVKLLLTVSLAGGNLAGSFLFAVPPDFRGAFLSRGTELRRGLPGLGENAIPAWYGEYRSTSPNGPSSFYVWATNEGLYLSPQEWKNRTWGTLRGLEKSDPRGRLIVLPTPNGFVGGQWNIFFLMPPQQTPVSQESPQRVPASLGPSGENVLFPAYLDRFIYFLGNAKTVSDVSLPALIEF